MSLELLCLYRFKYILIAAVCSINCVKSVSIRFSYVKCAKMPAIDAVSNVNNLKNGILASKFEIKRRSLVSFDRPTADFYESFLVVIHQEKMQLANKYKSKIQKFINMHKLD